MMSAKGDGEISAKEGEFSEGDEESAAKDGEIAGSFGGVSTLGMGDERPSVGVCEVITTKSSCLAMSACQVVLSWSRRRVPHPG